MINKFNFCFFISTNYMGNFGSTMFKAGFAPFFIPILAPYIPMLMRNFPGDPYYLLIKYVNRS